MLQHSHDIVIDLIPRGLLIWSPPRAFDGIDSDCNGIAKDSIRVKACYWNISPWQKRPCHGPCGLSNYINNVCMKGMCLQNVHLHRHPIIQNIHGLISSTMYVNWFEIVHPEKSIQSGTESTSLGNEANQIKNVLLWVFQSCIHDLESMVIWNDRIHVKFVFACQFIIPYSYYRIIRE